MPEIDRKQFAILRVIGEHSQPLGAGLIAKLLTAHGIELTERAIRYHLQALDEKGLTENLGRAGRQLTPLGKTELGNARVADQMALTSARIEALAYRADFDTETGTGTVVLNISLFQQSDVEEALRVMRPVLLSRFATSDMIAIFQPGDLIGDQPVPRGMVGIGTVCAVTTNAVFATHGIPIQSEFGGLLEISGHEPARFTDIIRYGGTSVDPVEVFIKSQATSVQQAVNTGKGKIGAAFRTCPGIARDHVMRLVDEMAAWRLRGVVAIGTESRSLMEIEVGVERMGIVVCAGLNPVAAAEEAGIPAVSHAMAAVIPYSALSSVK